MVTWPASLPQDQFLGLTDTRVDARVRSGDERRAGQDAPPVHGGAQNPEACRSL